MEDWDKQWIPLLALWHKGGPRPSPNLWPRGLTGRISHRLRKKRIKGNPDLSPKFPNLDLRGPLQSSKEVVLGQVKGAQSRKQTCSWLVTPVGFGQARGQCPTRGQQFQRAHERMQWRGGRHPVPRSLPSPASERLGAMKL